jgi:hypothetical protein
LKNFKKRENWKACVAGSRTSSYPNSRTVLYTVARSFLGGEGRKRNNTVVAQVAGDRSTAMWACLVWPGQLSVALIAGDRTNEVHHHNSNRPDRMGIGVGGAAAAASEIQKQPIAAAPHACSK